MTENETPMARWRRYASALAGNPGPVAFVDLDALDANIEALLGALDRAGVGDDFRVRVASKSVRVPALVRYILDGLGQRQGGVMAYDARDAALMSDHAGVTDLLMGYPIVARPWLDRLCSLASAGAVVMAMVDCEAHVKRASEAAMAAGVELALCIDVDASLQPLPALHVGVRRSPLRTASSVVRLARTIAATDGVRFAGIMSYEAQVAGLQDAVPGKFATNLLHRAVKAASVPVVARRRAAVVAALREAGVEAALVNGGGTGSLASTARDPVVTELTIGSGFYTPTLFDHYRAFSAETSQLRAAAFFALTVVRTPSPDHVTCAGGGYIASGPVGADRMPTIALPPGWRPLGTEGFGEVQTPLVRVGGPPLDVGDTVVARHAKAGELMTRFGVVHLVRGDAIEATVPTSRGLDPELP